MKQTLLAYFKLTKPTIGLLVLITGSAALFMEGSLMTRPIEFVIMMVALFMTAGSASAFNQYLERDIDKQMSRTAKKRPLTNGSLTPKAALTFAITIGIIGVATFAILFNLLSAALSLATIIFYSFFYTLWLKPRTHLNIVIGGAAGAMGPIITWAAATNGLALTPAVLFLVIFFWTPPHFWALAYCLKEDYRAAKYPMLPNVVSDRETLAQILRYTIITVVLTLLIPVIPEISMGLIYLIAAAGLGAAFLWFVLRVQKTMETKHSWGAFAFSILYLLGLFVAIMIDSVWTIRPWG